MSGEIINTTCGYCSTGCNLSVSVKEGKVTRINANPNFPVNLGSACIKGFQFLEHLNAPDRAMTPYLRNNNRELIPVDWDIALRAFSNNFKKIQRKNGKGSIAFISTGQMTNEEFALLGVLTRFGIGMTCGDGNTRQCMASAVVAYKQSFGFDAPPYTYKDFEESDVMIFFGANPVVTHPIMWKRVWMNKNNPEIFVVDPRKTITARIRKVHHYAVNPNSDLILLYGISKILIDNSWVDQNYINELIGFESFKAHVQKFPLKMVSEATGLNIEQINNLAVAIHNGKKVSFWWMVGINQSNQGVRTAQAIINLALVTGNIGKAGTGPNSITGQCNAMGSRLFSNTTNLLCGYEFSNSSDRKKFANLSGFNIKLIPDKPSIEYDRILEEIEDENIKGLWIICTNPIHSWIDRNRIVTALKKLEFLVVQDMFYTTETAQMADLILPAAGCGEKAGTFINSERRFGLIQKVCEPPGEAIANFEIFRKIAEYWGCADLFKDWKSPEAVFQILKRISKKQPCDFSGIKDYEMIAESGGIQWPFPVNSRHAKTERRLFEEGKFYHRDGRARLLFEDITEVPEKTSNQYPFILMTGRGTIAQWHTLTRSGKADILKRMSPKGPYIEINRQDAKNLNIKEAEWVVVSSKRGEIKARAKVCDTIKSGQVFMPMHYAETNILTNPAFDSYSRQPTYKYSAINLIKIGE
jgi:assimilatory nitrate reductase catalytic subunit